MPFLCRQPFLGEAEKVRLQHAGQFLGKNKVEHEIRVACSSFPSLI